MLMNLKGNCRNNWIMEGYPECIAIKSDNNRFELTFKLTNIHTPPNTNVHYYTPVKIVCKGTQARIVSEFLKPMMLVTCEGYFELGGNGKPAMACQRVLPSDPYMVDVEYKLTEEKREEVKV